MVNRPSALLMAVGVVAAAAVVVLGLALLPPPAPERLPWPEASTLRELNAHLAPVEQAPRGASTDGVVAAADPFGATAAPAGGMSPAPDRSWRLTAIVISGDRRVAVVNGQLVRPGESVDGGRVRAIRADQVVIERPDGSQSTLRLQPGEAE